MIRKNKNDNVQNDVFDIIELDNEYEDVYSDSSLEPESQPAPKKKHKFIRFLFKFVIAVLCLSFVVVFVISLFADYTKTSLKSNSYVSAIQLKNSPLVTNILLIGTDSEEGESQRSDTMLLVSLDYVHMKIKLTSFLRDSWVVNPETEKHFKLNSSYAYGGHQLVCDTIEYNYGIDIDHYLKVDFNMFVKIIDMLGGVDVEVTQAEAKFINSTTRQNIVSGESVHLNGEEALVYCRIRKLDSDYMRTQRQRKVISALINKVKTAGFKNLIDSFNSVLPMLETDLNSIEITGLVYRGGLAVTAFDIESMQMPSDDMFTTGMKYGNWVEIPDLEKCKTSLSHFIYGQ